MTSLITFKFTVHTSSGHTYTHTCLTDRLAFVFDCCALSDTSEDITYVGDRKWPIMNSWMARSAHVPDPYENTLTWNACLMCISMWQYKCNSRWLEQKLYTVSVRIVTSGIVNPGSQVCMRVSTLLNGWRVGEIWPSFQNKQNHIGTAPHRLVLFLLFHH